MIYDCFMFSNELDVLDIRLHALDDSVDRFVLIESARTHQGESKPLFFKENRNRFEPYLHKITHLFFTDYPVPPENISQQQKNWHFENAQRNALVNGLREARPTDTIILSDLDEIPSPSAIRKASQQHGITRCDLRMYYYYLNFRDYAAPFWKSGPKICPYSELLDGKSFVDFQFNDCVPKDANDGITLTMLRFVRPTRILGDAGWHFSYIGGIQHVITKLHSIADGVMPGSLTREQISERISRGDDVLSGKPRFFAEDIATGGFPSFIIENQNLLAHLIFAVSKEYFSQTRAKRFYVASRTKLLAFLIIVGRYTCPRPLKNFIWRMAFNR